MIRTGQFFRYLTATLLLPLIFTHAALAQVVDPKNVLIKNVHIVGGESDTEDKAPVSVLIRENKLEIITQDEVTLEDGTVTIDGNGGFVAGTLVVGEPPSFVIFDDDPAENFNVLVDSALHVVFAVNNGELVRNSLFEAQESPLQSAKSETTTAGWIAYTPPPIGHIQFVFRRYKME